jgi:hypothetical protein
MVDAAAHMSSALADVLGWGVLALLVVAAVILHVRRRRRHLFARRLPRLLRLSRSGMTQPPTTSAPGSAPDPFQVSEPCVGLGSPVGGSPADTVLEEGVRPSAPTRARHSRETFALLAQNADQSRRLAFTEARVEAVLATLPHDRWLVERYVLRAGHRIPFLILGETGVFTLWTLFGPPQWGDLSLVNTLANDVKDRLPGYPGPVHAGTCRALEPPIPPRWWYRAETQGGCWVMGLDWVIPWLEHFGHDHGLGGEDIKHFNTLAGPHWGHPTAPVPPGIPDLESWHPHG